MSTCNTPTNEHPKLWTAGLFDQHEAFEVLHGVLADPSIILIGHNIAFDFGVMLQNSENYERTVDLVFAAYNSNRIYDTQIRMQLLDISAGRFRREFNGHRWVEHKYNLGALSKRLLGWDLDKDTWRLRYGELRETPIDRWPEDAQEYPRDDARATLAVFLAQSNHESWLEDQHRQVKRELWLRLMSCWGLRTDAEGVDRFAGDLEEKLEDLRIQLQDLGLVRKSGKKDGVRDTKAAARLMVEICQSKGLTIVPTATQEKKMGVADWRPTNDADGWDYGEGGVALDADSCERADDIRLKLYAEYGVLSAVESKDVKLLRAGTIFPVHSHFGIVETGRTSSAGPNVQNIRRLPGIRECFVPRDGCIYMQADYPSLELRTLAQACIDLVGWSQLAQALNSGLDPHTEMASRILRVSYEECAARVKSKEPIATDTRQTAKVANFGFPGGLGAASLVVFARATYKVILTEEQAKELKQQWLAAWPEMREYFQLISSACEGENGGTILQLRSNRIRGKTRYTAACNTYFQGLGADATSEAGWLICDAMYRDRSSVLYGSRLVNFVHDEFIGECQDDSLASDRVKEICRLMKVGANRWLPHVPFTEIEPCLMDHWSKNAKTIIDATGRVKVWRNREIYNAK